VDHCHPSAWRIATAAAVQVAPRLTLLVAKASQEGPMAPSQVSMQDIETARVAIVLVVAGVMIFWRLVLRVMLAIVVVGAALGLFVLLQSMHR